MPCILTRLSDKNPQLQKETIAEKKTVLSYASLKSEILTNIEMILNSRSHPTRSELGRDPLVTSSVIAFGLDDFCGKTNAEINAASLVVAISEQIKYFEPRLDPDSVRVTLLKPEKKSDQCPHEISISISARIAVQPYEDEIICVSKLDLEVGRSSVNFGEKMNG